MCCLANIYVYMCMLLLLRYCYCPLPLFRVRVRVVMYCLLLLFRYCYCLLLLFRVRIQCQSYNYFRVAAMEISAHTRCHRGAGAGEKIRDWQDSTEAPDGDNDDSVPVL